MTAITRTEAVVVAKLRAATQWADVALAAWLARDRLGCDADTLRRAYKEAEGLERSLAAELGRVRGCRS